MLKSLILAMSQADIEKIVSPITQLCDVIVPVLLAVVGSLGSVWVIILGVKYAKADDPQEHEKAKNGLKNALIGFILIFILLIALEVGTDIFIRWFTDFDY